MLFYVILSAAVYKVSSYESKTTNTVKKEIQVLQEIIRTSIDAGLGLVEKQLEELVEKTSEIENDAVNLIEDHSLDIAENFQIYSNVLSAQDHNVSSCSEGLEEVITRIQDKSVSKIKKIVTLSLVKIRTTVIKSLPVLTKIQNKTIEIRKRAQDCAGFDDEECLDSLLVKLESLKEVIPSVIQTVMDRLEMQIKILESEIIADVQNNVNFLVEEYTDILFNFLLCIM